MKSVKLPSGAEFYAQEYNALRQDARAASFLLAHQQLGALALGTAPTNGQVIVLDINGTNVQFQAITGTIANPGDVKSPGTAAGFVANLFAALRNPFTTTSTFVALSAPNAQLVQYLGFSMPSGGTTITVFSLNNLTYAPLTSFSASTTVTGGSWTGQTMQLYVEDGTYYIAGTRYLFAGGSTPTVTAPVSHPRIDVLTVDSSGTLAWTTGTENASPSAPSYPVNKVAICELYNVVSETTLYDNENQQASQGYIYNDVRQTVSNPYGQFILDPGSEAQGDVLYYNGASSWARLGAGTSGYVLTTKGAAANPVWASANPSNAVIVTTQQQTSGATGATYYTCYTSASILAITAGQSIWVRAAFSRGIGYSTGVVTGRVQANGTTILSSAWTNEGTTGELTMEAFLTCPTTSSQLGMSMAGGPGITTSLNYVSSSANLASAFTFTFQMNDTTAGSQAQTYNLDYAIIYIFN